MGLQLPRLPEAIHDPISTDTSTVDHHLPERPLGNLMKGWLHRLASLVDRMYGDRSGQFGRFRLQGRDCRFIFKLKYAESGYE